MLVMRLSISEQAKCADFLHIQGFSFIIEPYYPIRGFMLYFLLVESFIGRRPSSASKP